jgi:hypothetical protein
VPCISNTLLIWSQRLSLHISIVSCGTNIWNIKTLRREIIGKYRPKLDKPTPSLLRKEVYMLRKKEHI